jgi:hypothetical protein
MDETCRVGHKSTSHTRIQQAQVESVTERGHERFQIPNALQVQRGDVGNSAFAHNVRAGGHRERKKSWLRRIWRQKNYNSKM